MREHINHLYEKYADELRIARKEQRAIRENDSSMKAQLDDIEAEITYLLIREHRPATVVEIGCLHGWSTTWILRALRDNDNDRGHLHSYDIRPDAASHVPVELSGTRWTFHQGDVRDQRRQLPDPIDYLFMDAAHSGGFARWYLEHVVPLLAPGTPVSVHDVFHGARPLPLTEGAVLLSWLNEHHVEYFTPSKAKARATYDQLNRLREQLGLSEPVHSGQDNPMLFFQTPPERHSNHFDAGQH
jgi:predicted O-methyltransferase YrrM